MIKSPFFLLICFFLTTKCGVLLVCFLGEVNDTKL